MATKLFDKAKRNKADEFYTQLTDIEAEMHNYKEQFKDKTILCNCDDPYESNFFKYFASNFQFLGLKKLIATCHGTSPIAGAELSLSDIKWINSDKKNVKKAYKIEIVEVTDENGDGAVDLADVEYLIRNQKNTISLLKDNGDFASEECIKLLLEADIVITNPPFSLFREFLSILVTYNKDFIIIGNTNALTYKETFNLFKEDRIRTGYTNFNVGMFFIVPDSYEKYHKIENGKKLVRVATSCWFTSLPVEKHKEFITLYKRYSHEEYPKYDNYDAINVNKYVDIPYDYDGMIGVPITFLDKYNPQQFEIITITTRNDTSGLRHKKYTLNDAKNFGDLNGAPVLKTKDEFKNVYARILIKRKGIKI